VDFLEWLYKCHCCENYRCQNDVLYVKAPQNDGYDNRRGVMMGMR